MSLRFLPAAQEELDAAALYLDKRVQGLGEELVDDVERTGALVVEFPQIGRQLDSTHRVVPVQCFSFNLIYRTIGGDTVVVAVAHKRRRPGYWRRRS
jgi:toxin ParE1/3/4